MQYQFVKKAEHYKEELVRKEFRYENVQRNKNNL